MPLDVLDRQTLSGLPEISGLKTGYGVKVSELSVDQLFALHERTGFLDPAKAAGFQPYSEMIRGNWRRLLRTGNALLYLISAPPAFRAYPITWSNPSARERLALVFENYRRRPITVVPASDMDSWDSPVEPSKEEKMAMQTRGESGSD